MKIKLDKLHTLWYENEKGEKAIPSGPGYYSPPSGYHYQHVRDTALDHRVHKGILTSDVDGCSHPEEYVTRTGGWIDGIEGRECKRCRGTQTRTTGTAWPTKWDANGSVTICGGSMGWNNELVTEMVRQGKTAVEAILISAIACERCLNVLLHQYGLQGGYAELSDDWIRARTVCDFCKDMEPAVNIVRSGPWA